MIWSVKALPFIPAARVRFPAGWGILILYLSWDWEYVLCVVLCCLWRWLWHSADHRFREAHACVKGNGIPITGHESPRGCERNGPHRLFTAIALEEVGWLALRSAVFTPGKPRYSFYRRLSGPRASLETNEWRLISTPPPPRIEPGPSSL